MIVLDASVAVKWFVEDEPLIVEAREVLAGVELQPQNYLVPELFAAECLAVLSRLRGATTERVRDSMARLNSLGLTRISLGDDVLFRAASFAVEWELSGYDAIYVALASLTDSVWLTADAKAARRVRQKSLVRVL